MNIKRLKTEFKILTLTAGLIYLSSCKQNDYKENLLVESVSVSESFDAVLGDSQTISSSNNLPPFNDLKIIKSANVRYKVKEVKMATNQIKQLVDEYGAYITDLQFESSLYSLENRFTIKIPQQHFNTMMDSIVKVAEFIDFETITTEDVTEEYIDVQTRLKTKLEVKERYESILRKNAKTVEDILATEDKLGAIQEEIEASQGKLKYFANKVAFSTIQIDLYETVDYKEEPDVYNKTFWAKSKDGLVFGWNFIESTTIALLHIWPLIIIGGLLSFFIKKRLRKRT